MVRAKVVVVAVLIGWSIAALAMLPRGKLATYDYGELYLVRTVSVGDSAMACFVAGANKAIWAKRGAFVGKQLGHIEEIEKTYIVVTTAVAVNGSDWVSMSFRWPLAERKDLTDRCSSPPKNFDEFNEG